MSGLTSKAMSFSSGLGPPLMALIIFLKIPTKQALIWAIIHRLPRPNRPIAIAILSGSSSSASFPPVMEKYLGMHTKIYTFYQLHIS